MEKEWLVTNGLGGYASSTVSGANTRRYHGLLVAALEPPADRNVLVAKIEERILVNGEYIDLSTNQYPDKLYPNGSQYLKNFNRAPDPCWEFEKDDWKLQKRILMVQQSNTTLVSYTNKGRNPMQLELHPLYAYNQFHDIFHENPITDFHSEVTSNKLTTYPEHGSIPVYTSWNLGRFSMARAWYKHIQLVEEQKRGLEFNCDYYRIGYLEVELQPEEELVLCFSLEEAIAQKDLKKLVAITRNKASRTNHEKKTGFYADLLRSGKQFMVERHSTKSKSIIAGYHWFTDWGRDTMIAMRGLMIADGDKTTSKSILTTYFKSVDQGMIPNRFPDNSKDAVQYNTIDATLWLFVTLYEYHQKFQDKAFIKKQLKVLKDILDWHIKGTRYQIQVTGEGFLYGGEEGVQLTWMDAIVGGKVITPRIGCPVEINALWYNALKIYQSFCLELNLEMDVAYIEVLERFKANFVKMFTNPEGTLYDVIVPHRSSDNSFRPNQMFWLSLPYTVLGKAQERAIFEAIKEKLFTPYGLRTLDQDDPQFKGTYEGNHEQRDHSYHQGTVWPFLLYGYYHSFFKIYGSSVKHKKQVLKELEPLQAHFYSEHGLYCISEIFDGLAPQAGKGCIQQAWSVAALIKLYTEYGLYK